jgi:ParB-like chromosome segregation protein Spo0J
VTKRIPGSGPYQLLPALSSDEFTALKADIATHGVLVAVEVDEAGNLLDGHHRVRAWTELRAEGIRVGDYPRVVRRFDSEDERIGHVLSLNLTRRHLSVSGRRALVADLRSRGWSTRRIAGAVGSSKSTVDRDLSGVPNGTTGRIVGADGKSYRPTRPRSRPSVVVSSARGQRRAEAALVALGDEAPGRMLDVRKAEELGRIASLERRRAQRVPAVANGAGFRIECCDFRDLALADASVDAIICDPPYSNEYLPLWSDLSAWAARVLKPGRLLIAYAGKLALPDHVARLGERLEYVWAGATAMPGRHSIIRSRMIRARWRPWLIYSAGPYRPRTWLLDTATAEGVGEKGPTDHPWGQTPGPFVQLVTMATEPGELVVDPFLGQGTTAIATVQAGRRFLGCDVDPGAVSLALERLEPSA